jgi:hypothetical protein
VYFLTFKIICNEKNEKSKKKVLMHSDLVRMAMLFPPKESTEGQDLSTREVGKKFLEELKEQGPTLDRVGKVFVKFIKKRD